MNCTCAVCGQPFAGKRSDALYCGKICGNRSRNKTYRAAHPDRLKKSRFTANARAESRIVLRARHRAKKNGIPFSITAADVTIPEFCPVLGIKLVRHVGRKGCHPESPSLDRMVAADGYVPGNVRVISARANLIKKDASLEEMRRVLAYMEGAL